MQLHIDNREPKQIINYLTALNEAATEKIEIIIKTLELGDYILYDEKTEQNIFIIERKSLADLESSIKDGRYNEQSFRLNGLDIHNHNIYYLIEGSIINYKHGYFKNTLYAAVFSLGYYKGFSTINTINNIESAEYIYNFCLKFIREKQKIGFYCEKSLENNNKYRISYDLSENVIKTSKKANITRENINSIMLMQIPGVSITTANTILNKFNTMKNLIEQLEKDKTCLDSLKLEQSNRKISKSVIANIIKFLV
jgi:ERCC4-type nuclease